MIINYISYFLNIAGITQDIYRRLVNDEIDIMIVTSSMSVEYARKMTEISAF